MLGGLNVTVRVRQISNSNYDLNLGLPIEATFSRDPVQTRSTLSHDLLLTAHLI